MAVRGDFFGLDSATLASLLTAYTTALTAIATTGQAYTIAGRQFTRADLDQIRRTIAEIKAAQNYNTGAQPDQTYPAFGSPY